jgi:hypothetical protein
MSHRWEATIAPGSEPDSACQTLTLSDSALATGPPLTAVIAPGGTSTTHVYGLVARVALTRPAFGFRVEHDMPAGVELIEARPKATVVGEHLIWQIGRVDPGQKLRLEVVVRVLPGTVLNPEDIATFTATYSQNLYFEVPVVRPRLTARMSGPATANLGESVEYILDVASAGSAPVQDARATINLPPAFDHPEGPVLAFALGTIKPGEFRRIAVPVRVMRTGAAVMRAEIVGPADRQAHVEIATQVS